MIGKKKLELGTAYALHLKFGLKKPTFQAFRQAMDLALQQLQILSSELELTHESFPWGPDNEWSAEVFKFQEPELEMWVGTLIDAYKADGSNPDEKTCNDHVVLRIHTGKKHVPAMAGPTVAITNPIVQLGYEIIDVNALDFPTILEMIDYTGEKKRKRK